MPAEDFKNFKLPTTRRSPPSSTISRSRTSSCRPRATLASFTVRFRQNVQSYFTVKAASASVIAPKVEKLLAAPAAAAPKPPRAVLVLPYYETVAGKKLLWEDNNRWMTVWQTAPPKIPGVSLLVPLGDISDVSTGPTDAVWSGTLAGIEKLRSNYNADEVLVAVANKSGPSLAVDLYAYKNGRFTQLPSLAPYVGPGGDAEAMKQGEAAVATYLAQEATADAAPQLQIKAPAPMRPHCPRP